MRFWPIPFNLFSFEEKNFLQFAFCSTCQNWYFLGLGRNFVPWPRFLLSDMCFEICRASWFILGYFWAMFKHSICPKKALEVQNSPLFMRGSKFEIYQIARLELWIGPSSSCLIEILLKSLQFDVWVIVDMFLIGFWPIPFTFFPLKKKKLLWFEFCSICGNWYFFEVGSNFVPRPRFLLSDMCFEICRASWFILGYFWAMFKHSICPKKALEVQNSPLFMRGSKFEIYQIARLELWIGPSSSCLIEILLKSLQFDVWVIVDMFLIRLGLSKPKFKIKDRFWQILSQIGGGLNEIVKKKTSRENRCNFWSGNTKKASNVANGSHLTGAKTLLQDGVNQKMF